MPLAMSRPWKHPDSGVYWLRKGVPDDLRALVGKREEKRSLGTRDPVEAKRRHAEALAEIGSGGPTCVRDQRSSRRGRRTNWPWSFMTGGCSNTRITQASRQPGMLTLPTGCSHLKRARNRMIIYTKLLRSRSILTDFESCRWNRGVGNWLTSLPRLGELLLNEEGRRILARAVAAALQRASLTLAQLAKGATFSNIFPLAHGSGAPRLASSQSPLPLMDLVKGSGSRTSARSQDALRVVSGGESVEGLPGP